jgi:hypothetical protein
MNGKCVICESEHGEWVDSQHKAGLSTREIAKALEAEFGLSVSHVTVASHLNHGDKSDRTAELEQRIRNLELWMATAIPDITSVTWHEHNAGGDETYSLSSGALYRSSIPNPKGLESEMAAISAALMSKHKEESAARKEQQRREAVKRNESIAAEKREREEMAERARAKIEKERIELLRKEVSAYDNGEASK